MIRIAFFGYTIMDWLILTKWAKDNNLQPPLRKLDEANINQTSPVATLKALEGFLHLNACKFLTLSFLVATPYKVTVDYPNIEQSRITVDHDGTTLYLLQASMYTWCLLITSLPNDLILQDILGLLRSRGLWKWWETNQGNNR